MIKSEYEHSLEYFLQTYNVFLHHAIRWHKHTRHSSSTLKDLLLTWIHPKGIPNLVNTMALHFSVPLPYPKAAQEHFSFQLPRHFPTKDPNQENIPMNRSEPTSQEKDIGKVKIKQEDPDDLSYSEDSRLIEKESSFVESDGRSYKRGPYKSYTTVQKMKAVDLYQQGFMSITEISRKLGIPCKNIKRWSEEGINRKRGGGRRKTNPRMEEEVYRWITQNHDFGDYLSIEDIQRYALSRSRDPTFKASRGWATKFSDRFNLRTKYLLN